MPGAPAVVQHPAPASIEASLDRPDADSGDFSECNCQACAKRSVKCDKIKPICSSCRSRQLQCLYQAPPPRRRKRQLSGGDIDEKLAQYERILLKHGLLQQDDGSSPPTECTPQEPVNLRFIEPHAERSRMGKSCGPSGQVEIYKQHSLASPRR